MNKNQVKATLLLVMVFGISVTFGGEWVLFNKDTWRVTGGAAFDFGVKTRLTTNARVPYVSPFASGLTAEAAKEKAEKGTLVSPTKREYSSGAWIDTDDDTTGVHPDGKYTHYYHIPGKPGKVNAGSVFSLGEVPYAEVSSIGVDSGLAPHRTRDETYMPGLSVELSHGLYQAPEDKWGVNLAVGFNYFFRKNVYKSQSAWNSSSTVKAGAYESKVDAGDAYLSDDSFEDWNWGSDGVSSWYGCAADGTGAAGPINADGVYSVLAKSGERTDTSVGRMTLRGDYRNLEIMLALKPYYDVKDWLRIMGTIGAVVSRQQFDLRMSQAGNALSRGYKEDFHEWDVYGIAGLGIIFRHKDWTLGCDFLARFLDDDLKIDCPYANGSIERGRWMFRVMLGYEF